MPEHKQGHAPAAPAAAAPETLAALVAQMRRWNKEGATLVNTGYIADRIERAAKNTENAFGMALAIEDGLRKRDKQSAPVNAAARKFDEAAFDEAVSKPNGWSDVADPVAEIRRMRDGGAPGNAAALRDALEWVADFSSDDYIDDEYSTDGENLQRAAERARAALAAPARNCDKFQTAEEAIQTYAAKCDGDDHPDFGMFGYWLYAQAEGEVK